MKYCSDPRIYRTIYQINQGGNMNILFNNNDEFWSKKEIKEINRKSKIKTLIKKILKCRF